MTRRCSPAERLPKGKVGPMAADRGVTAAPASDPFDPELFNRRFAPPAPPQRPTSVPPTSDPDDPPLPPTGEPFGPDTERP